jgi:hypothetical protein
MNIRKTVAGLALAGALTVAGAGSAFAQTDPSSSSPPFPRHPNLTCPEAIQRVATAQGHLDQLKAAVADLRVLRDQLVAEGHTQWAQRLTDVIQRFEARIAKVQDRLTNAEQRVREQCGPEADTGSAAT